MSRGWRIVCTERRLDPVTESCVPWARINRRSSSVDGGVLESCSDVQFCLPRRQAKQTEMNGFLFFFNWIHCLAFVLSGLCSGTVRKPLTHSWIISNKSATDMMIMTSCQCFTYQSNQVMCVSSEKLQIITLWGQQVKCNALPSSIFLHLQDYRPSFLNIFVSWEFSFSIIFIPQKKNRDLKWISPAGSLRPSGRLHDSDKCDRSIFFFFLWFPSV